MKVLGINANVHDSSVCLLEDGRVVYAVEEERLNRRKHFGGFPERALARALEAAGGMAQVDLVVHPWRPWRFYREELSEHLPRLLSAKTFLHLHTLFRSHDEMAQYLMVDRRFRRDPAVRRYATCGHHTAHAASAFLASPFEEAAVLTYDARGEDVATVLWEGRGTALREVRRFRLPHSLGHLYATVTRYLGFVSGDEEYKVMGLAAYGRPAYKDWFDRAVALAPDGGYRISRAHLDYYRGFTRRMLALGPPSRDGLRPDQRQMDLAASLQARFEEVVLHMARWLRSATGLKDLCVAGGCGLNGVVNGRLAREAGFERVWVQPAAHDAGLSVGAALWGWHALLGGKRGAAMDRADFGDAFEGEAVTGVLDRCRVGYRVLEDPAREAAGLIAAGRIVGWFQGRAEFGPRALGNRSILADPGRPDMKDRLNRVIKQREGFRPFAPACREEDVSRYFEWDRPLPFMVFVFPVRPEYRGRLPAVTHVDGSARIQTVRRDVNERFWSLIGHLEGLTGMGVVLNTSFNVQGEPMVNDPSDALRTFFSSGMDALILDRYLVMK